MVIIFLEMNNLYPLKFTPILKDKIWGGTRLGEVLKKKNASSKCGESWEISGYGNDISVVSNGIYTGKKLTDLIAKYKGKLLGESVYKRFKKNFPLLIKFIDANDDLSVQVHPNDKMAKERHKSFGKTEMWYVMESNPGSKLISGFNQPMTPQRLLKHVNDKKVVDVLNFEETTPGDVFFLPSGRIHAIGSGILLAEIQQSSDTTYRVYDWDRVDDQGKPRELHLDLSLEAIDYEFHGNYRENYTEVENGTAKIVQCHYFTVNLINCEMPVLKNYNAIDSFVIFISVKGSVDLDCGINGKITIKRGESILLPALIKEITIIPEKESKLLEVYISK